MNKRKINKWGVFSIGLGIIILSLIFAMLFVEKIPRGYVGAVYSIKGGTSNEILTEGWHVISPMKKITDYSVATEQLLLTKDEREGSDGNESFMTTCKDGVLNIDLEMSYHFEAEDIPDIAKKYRGLSGQDIVDTRITSKVKTYVNEITSQYTVLEAYMDKKTELNTKVTQHLKDKLKEYGVVVESATIPRAQPDKEIEQAITQRSKKAQETEAAKQEQEKQKILAETKLIEAQGEANATIEKARGEAEANRQIAQSMTPQLIQKIEAEARLKHGWINVSGASNVIVDERK